MGGKWSEPLGPAALARFGPVYTSRLSELSPQPHPGSADRCFSAILCHHSSQRDEPTWLVLQGRGACGWVWFVSYRKLMSSEIPFLQVWHLS